MEVNSNLDLDVSKEDIFAYLDVEILEDNMKDQIFRRNTTTMNYLEAFDEKFFSIISLYGTELDINEELNATRNKFYNIAWSGILENLGLKVELLETILDEELINLIKAFYQFFVLEINDNIRNLYYNEIIINSKSIIKSYKNIINTSDIYFSSAKKEFGKDTAVIISSVDSFIANYKVETIEDFIEDIISDEDRNELNNSIILNAFNENSNYIKDITCNPTVLNNYISTIYQENKSSIEIDVTYKLIAYFRDNKN